MPSASTYVQIGAGAGDQDARAGYRDGFSEYVKSLPQESVGRIVLVEPNPVNIAGLRTCWESYPCAEIHELGIAPYPTMTSATFYYSENDGPHFQVMSMKPDHVTKHYPSDSLKTITVPCVGLEDFIHETVGPEKIDLLALDIEGIEKEVMLGTDWASIDCRDLSLEYIHLGDDLQLLANHLATFGFQFVGQGVDHNGFDVLFRRM
ncbi:MAG: FkbM family methyltransferase [Austwickia sp.]|nr:FkbM family methyltransferase [Austwickia sp.]